MTFIELTPRGVKFTQLQEGTYYYVYDDGVKGAKRYKKGDKVRGHLTAGTGHLLNQAEINQWVGKDIPKDVVDRWFDDDTDIAEKAVYDLVDVPIKSNQRDVLIDFTFNNGVGAFRKSTLLRVLNAGDYDKVPAQLLRWTKSTINGVKVDLPGLVKRCNDRVAYWNSPEFATSPYDSDTNNGTNIAEPAPKPTTPIEWASVAIGGISGLAGFSGAGGFFGVALGIALLVATGVGAFYIVRRIVAPR